MREIKFRAWRSDKGYTENVQDTYDSNPWGDHEYYESIGEVLKFADMYGTVIEQYTGLKDKNGRDIYEGDVVRTSYKFSNDVPENRMAVVEWDTCNPCFVLHWINEKRTDGYEYDFVKAGMMSLEVIGNIHENKELLNA